MEHICEYLKYKHQKIDLVFPNTEYQRCVLFDADGNVVLQVVFFCPYCSEDFRSECLWQIPGRPQENGILRRAHLASHK